MNKFTTKIFQTVFVLIFIFLTYLFPVEIYSQTDSSDWSKPLSLCWEVKTNNTTSITPASDNQIIIFVLSDSVQAFDTENGKLIWKNDLNSENVGHIDIKDKFLFIKSAQQSSANKLSNKITIIESKSGVPYNIIENSDSQLNNEFYILEKIRNKHPAEIITKIYFENNKPQLLLGTKLGSIKLLNTQTFRKLWDIKVGGEITDILPDNNTNFIISSKDNYVYSIKKDNGKLDWRLKLKGRPIGITLTGRNLITTVDHSSNNALIIDIETGRILNQISFEKDTYFVSKPIYTNNKLIFTTNKGLSAFSTTCSKKGKLEN